MVTFSISPGHPFGPQPVPEDVEPIVFEAGPTRLTALRAAASGRHRGSALIIPGFTGSKEDFLDFAPLLASRGFEVWVYSQRGQADSSSPVGVENYSLDQLCADAMAIVRAIAHGDTPLHLLGHSFGGVVARQAAIGHPEQFASLTLLGSGPRAIPRNPQAELAVSMVKALGTSLIFTGAHPGVADEPQADPALEMERLRAHATSIDNILAIADILGSYPDRSDELAATGLPVNLVYGAEDTVWPQEWYRSEQALLRAHLSVIPDAGHSAQLDQPQALAAVITDFWNTIEPGKGTHE